MKPFDLEKAKAGHAVCTRSGLNVRLLCFDKKGIYPICGLLHDAHYQNETEQCWKNDGSYQMVITGTPYDLFMKDDSNKRKEETYYALRVTARDRIYLTRSWESLTDAIIAKLSFEKDINTHQDKYQLTQFEVVELTVKRVID